MRTNLEVVSAAFPAYPGEDEETNPGRFGKRLAEFVAAALVDAGMSVGSPYAESWGWAVAVDNPDFPLWVGCGNVEGEVSAFLCFIEPGRPLVRRGLRRVSTVERVEAVAAALTEACERCPDLTYTWEPTLT